MQTKVWEECRTVSCSTKAAAARRAPPNSYHVSLIVLIICIASHIQYTLAFTLCPRRLDSRSQLAVSSTVSSPTPLQQWADDEDDNKQNNDARYKKSSSNNGSSDNNTAPRKWIKQMFGKAKTLERKGQWRKATDLLQLILQHDPYDAYSHLALARLEARRGSSNAQQVFERGTLACPNSVHLWQAWAVYEENRSTLRARQLYEKALSVEHDNPYVCHAYGLMESRLGNDKTAMELYRRGLAKSTTAALVCQMGELLITKNEFVKAKQLYAQHTPKLAHSLREMTEVYLASAWLEERYFDNPQQARNIINEALTKDPSSGKAQVALARLEGRNRRFDDESRIATIRRRLANTCIRGSTVADMKKQETPKNGRVYNAWARIEAQARRYTSAKNILKKGIALYPNDYNLLQAAGKLEERTGNYTGARDLYVASLHLQPSAPALVAYAQLEVRQPENGVVNFDKVRQLFEEALLLNPRHGPAYNSFGNAELGQGNIDAARAIYRRGIAAKCFDVASVYHGYARLELSIGNVQEARELLQKGRREARRMDLSTDSPSRDRAAYLTHTLGMLELNSNRAQDAMEAFSEGIRRYGNSSQLLLGSALSEIKLGNEDKARKLFEQAVIVDSKHAHAWQAWGVMEMRAGNWQVAKTLFEYGTKSSPKHGALWTSYAIAEGRLGNATSARLLFAKGIDNAPDHAPLYQAWASLEVREQNYNVARTLISAALTKDKTHESGWLVAADIEYQLGNTGLVGLILRRAIECSPNSARLYNALGNHLLRTGKVSEAREVYNKGIDIDPLYAPLYHSLAELEASIFNVEGLAQLNKRAAAYFDPNSHTSSRSAVDEAWGTKIKANRNRNLPKGVIALANRIVADDDSSNNKSTIDPSAFIAALNDNLMEDGLVGQLLQINEDN